MTNEEARDQIVIFMCILQKVINDRDKQALEMAIQALEQSSGDAVSRQAVNEIINDIRDCISVEGYCAILERLKKLPSVKQKSETVTEFADRCRECGAKYGKLLKQEPKTVALLEKTYADFCKCECGEGWLKIDGKEYFTDVGYALEGMGIFMQVYKQRLAESEEV